jgi:hypothetical protein
MLLSKELELPRPGLIPYFICDEAGSLVFHVIVIELDEDEGLICEKTGGFVSSTTLIFTEAV